MACAAPPTAIHGDPQEIADAMSPKNRVQLIRARTMQKKCGIRDAETQCPEQFRKRQQRKMPILASCGQFRERLRTEQEHLSSKQFTMPEFPFVHAQDVGRYTPGNPKEIRIPGFDPRPVWSNTEGPIFRQAGSKKAHNP
jgi:hypothetical protein